MILFSAALAFAIAALLILIAGWALAKVYLVMWSMVIAVLAAVCLLIGALLKRHLLFPAGGRDADAPDLTPQGSSPVSQLAHAGAPAFSGAPGHPVATPIQVPPGTHHGALPPAPFPPRRAEATAPVRRPPVQPGRPLDPEDIVLVVPGRKRFHLANCRQLMGREIEELTYEEAREEGFSPCTTCLPELSARAADEPPQPRPTRRQGSRAEAGPTRPAGATGGRDTTDFKAAKDPAAADATVTAHRSVSAQDAAPVTDPATTGDGSSTGSDTARPGTGSGQSRSEQPRTEKPRPETAASGTGASGTSGTEAPQLDWFQRNMLPSVPSGADSRPAPQEEKAAGSPSAPEPSKGDWFSAAKTRPAAPQPESSPSESSPTGSGRADNARTAEPESDATKGAENGSPWARAAEPESAKKASAPAADAKAADADPKSAEPKSTELKSAEPKGAEPKAAEAKRAEPGSTGSKVAERESARPDSDRPEGATAKTADSASTGKSRPDTADRGDDASGTADAEPETAAEITQPGRAGFRAVSASPGAASRGSSTTGSTDAPASAAGSSEAAGTSARSGSAPDPVRPAGDAADRTSGDEKDRREASTEARAKDAAEDAAKDPAAEGPATTAIKETGRESGKGTAKDSTEDTVKTAAEGAGEQGAPGSEARESGSAELEDDENTNTFAAVRPGSARRVPPGSVKVMVGTRRYHSSECPLISGIEDDSIEVMTKQDAEQAGLTHCSVCEAR